MATYKIALKLYQEAAGDANALVRISVNGNVVADNVEVTKTSDADPDLFVYEVAGLPDSGDGVSVPVKVELLNDLFIDSDNDRNVRWIGCGYACKWSDDNYYSGPYGLDHNDDPDIILVDRPVADQITLDSGVTLTNYRVKALSDNDFNWQGALEYTGDENGVVDLSAGWYHYNITVNYVEVNLPLQRMFVKH